MRAKSLLLRFTILKRNSSACTVKNAMDKWTQILKKENVPEPRESTLNIMAHILQKKQFVEVQRQSSSLLTRNQYQRFEELCKQRLQRKPVQYIIGEWDFHGMTLKMKPPVFIPRPETEELASLAIDKLRDQISCNGSTPELKVLEIGCGTGAITLSILKENPQVKCIAVDKNPKCCSLTEENARHLGLLTHNLTVINSTLSANGFDKELPYSQFDLIVSNPPYIPKPQIAYLDPEITRYEDSAAYDGGDDGLQTVNHIIQYSETALKPYGCLLLEVALEHPEILKSNLKQISRRFRTLIVHNDFTKRPRFVEISE